jgi:hypothetical protein
VYCDGNLCGTGQICCFNPDTATPPDHCGQRGMCASSTSDGIFTEVSCSGPGYCPGGYCCAQFTLQNTMPPRRHYTSIACQAQCNSPFQETIVCDPSAANPCPYGGQCQMSGILSVPYYVCN